MIVPYNAIPCYTRKKRWGILWQDLRNTSPQLCSLSPATITNIVQFYVKNGITDIIRYNISPNSSAALRKVDGRAEAHIIQGAAAHAPGSVVTTTYRPAPAGTNRMGERPQ